jgi:hypothetical protein
MVRLQTLDLRIGVRVPASQPLIPPIPQRSQAALLHFAAQRDVASQVRLFSDS